jgi:hypothetical protein
VVGSARTSASDETRVASSSPCCLESCQVPLRVLSFFAREFRNCRTPTPRSGCASRLGACAGWVVVNCLRGACGCGSVVAPYRSSDETRSVLGSSDQRCEHDVNFPLNPHSLASHTHTHTTHTHIIVTSAVCCTPSRVAATASLVGQSCMTWKLLIWVYSVVTFLKKCVCVCVLDGVISAQESVNSSPFSFMGTSCCRTLLAARHLSPHPHTHTLTRLALTLGYAGVIGHGSGCCRDHPAVEASCRGARDPRSWDDGSTALRRVSPRHGESRNPRLAVCVMSCVASCRLGRGPSLS